MNTTAQGHVGPFPFATLEALTRADVVIAARLRRVASDHVDLVAIERALEELAGERVRAKVRGVRRIDAARGSDDAVGVLLAAPGPHVNGRILIEAEGALAAAFTAHALRRKAPRVVDASRAPSPSIAGAFAAVVVAALRRAHAGAVTRVIAAGPGANLARDLRLAERDVTCISLTVLLGDDAFDARVSIPDALVPSPRTRASLSRDDLTRMGDASISLPLVMTTTLAARDDLAQLGRGDVFVPTKSIITVTASGAVLGPVALVAPSAERGLSVNLAEDGRLVVRGLLESHPWERDLTMSSSREGHPTETTTVQVLEAIEEAPVVVRVELGAVEMKAREWASLAPGDIVTLGRKVGDPAILRVGGVELARGELVQVDGEYGVRIVARSGADGDGR